ncbi:MAG TPA: hypothetical protein VM243_09845 [Phycisphaerae bacterium]|nr:hypothetical protein [Phycisphaerae bacterium]
MNQPSIRALRFWQEHEQRVLEVVCLALADLQDAEQLPTDEPGLNRKLLLCLHRVNFRLLQQGRGVQTPFVWEAQNQPLADDETHTSREEKRPDLQCGFVNLQETDGDRASMFYTIECKRLGRATNRWVFNVNYVEKGVVRFVTEEHGYGKATPSGAMVGYVQSMELDDILGEVNAAVEKRSLPVIVLAGSGWQENPVARLDHRLTRPASLLSPFDLRHMWVDLRGHPSD